MCSITVAPLPRARRGRSGASRKSSRPISAPGRRARMLRLERICARYGAIMAVRDVSLEVGQGELVALIGANGAGKTTTLSTIAGVVRAAAGTVTLLGENITDLPP